MTSKAQPLLWNSSPLGSHNVNPTNKLNESKRAMRNANALSRREATRRDATRWTTRNARIDSKWSELFIKHWGLLTLKPPESTVLSTVYKSSETLYYKCFVLVFNASIYSILNSVQYLLFINFYSISLKPDSFRLCGQLENKRMEYADTSQTHK